MTQKRFNRNTGDLLLIRLADRSYCYGRVLPEPLMAFYDLNSQDKLPTELVKAAPILFKVWVMNHAITDGRWLYLHSWPLEAEFLSPSEFFKQDSISGAICKYVDSKEIPASVEECSGLERAAVWDPEHVEERLADHFAGVPNKWVEALRIKA